MDARVERIQTGKADGNAWVIGDDEEVIVVDPGGDTDPVFEAVGDREIIAVICTHGHAAHTAGAPAVAERDESPVALHRRDRLHWREGHGDEMPEIERADPDLTVDARTQPDANRMIDGCGQHGSAVLVEPVGEIGATTDEADPERRGGVDRPAVGLHTAQSRGWVAPNG